MGDCVKIFYNSRCYVCKIIYIFLIHKYFCEIFLIYVVKMIEK